MSIVVGQESWKAARRTEDITYAVRDVLLVAQKAKESGKQMLYLNIGDPNQYDFDTPQPLKEAVAKALFDGANGYAPSPGVATALEAIRRDADSKGIGNVCDVFTSYGASEGIETCAAALADPGDNIILPSPGYPLYSAVNAKLNIESRFYRLDESNGWQPDVEDIAAKIDRNSKAIVVINPNNPTGSVYSRETLLAVIELARRHRLMIFSDEIYDKIIYDDEARHIPTASLAEDVPVITFNGLSKCFLAPGWRIGWAIISGPGKLLQHYIAAIHKMTRARLCISHPFQFAIKPALEGGLTHLPEMMMKLRQRRDVIVEGFNRIEGISCVEPKGAFYAFPKIEFAMQDKKFVEELALQTGVVVVHGSGFGKLAGDGHFRLVFLPQPEILQKAIAQIDQFTKKLLGT